jgi:uncharacterized protein
MKTVLLALIRLYQLTLSSVTGRSCRYLPTCSDYARQAIEKHGVGRGSLLAVARVSRCHPWGDDGFDPVPDEYAGPVWRLNKKAGK